MKKTAVGEQKNLHKVSRPAWGSRAILITLTVTIVGICVWMLSNTDGLRQAVDEKTKAYVEEVSVQLASDIDYRLSKIQMDLEMLKDSIKQFDRHSQKDALENFLQRKADILDFTNLILLYKDGEVFSSEGVQEEVLQAQGIQDARLGKYGVSFLGNQEILYSIPVYENGTITGVLAGLRSKENMQDLIQPRSFSGQGLSCIVDQKGEVIVSPTELDPFLHLEDIFRQGDTEAASAILEMQSNMQENKGGTFFLTAADSSNLVLSYNPLPSYDWVLLTLVPSNLISHDTDHFVAQMYIIVFGIICLFALILWLSFHLHKRYYRRLEKVAFTDPVTGGMNNAAFQLKCRELISQAKPGSYTVLLLNLRNFKLINETFGSREGDRTLRHVMGILKEEVGEKEAAARGDADVFYLCLQENRQEVLQNRLDAIREKINAFNQGRKDPYYLTVNAGAYVVEDPELEITLAQDRAQTAYQSRTSRQENVCVFYDAAFTQKLKEERNLNNLFRESLAKRFFKVYLQPKVYPGSGKTAGAEALIRWEHPERGTIYPSEFIPLFERNGKICALDLFVFEEVCRMLHRRKERGMPCCPVSVNLSRAHFAAKDFLEPFGKLAKAYEIPEGWIELEFTESVFFEEEDIERAKEQIREMHRMGFRCSLDDFGAGFSSLGLLMEFDVDAIKLDRRFFRNIQSRKSRIVVESVVGLARRIGADVVAEGVETEEQLQFARDTGCPMVQGYVYAKPMPMQTFEEQWLAENKL